MKKILFLFLLSLCTLGARAQTNKEERESASPLLNTKIERRCDYFDIDGMPYINVVAYIQSKNSDYLNTHSVKVVVKKEGKKVYKKTFRNCFLYVFSNGQIQVAKQTFNKMAISPYKDKESGKKEWFGKIREKEGIWED